tara:strand:+ start:4574 stop:4876 length:303 start_codon:yes stop_codon:yes gene_type:complete
MYSNSDEKFVKQVQRLQNLKITIEELNETYHKQLFNIFHKNNIKYSENRNGIFINISNLNEEVTKELEKHIEYIKKQEKQLKDIENKKKKYKKIIDNCNP